MKTSSNHRRRFLSALLAAALAPALGVSAAASATHVEVWKDPTCGCCKEWIAHMRRAGFTVTVQDAGNAKARSRAGIESRYGSCHTAFVAGYAIEGHVPARDIQRLLRERPDAIGLAVPGMVSGSPGMEQGGPPQPYTVLLLHKDGSSSGYARYPA